MACYVVNQNDPAARQEGVCLARIEDYYECLHHKKEVGNSACSTPGQNNLLNEFIQFARAKAMQEALRKAEAAHPRENVPKIGQIRSLGLIGKEEETKSILGAT